MVTVDFLVDAVEEAFLLEDETFFDELVSFLMLEVVSFKLETGLTVVAGFIEVEDFLLLVLAFLVLELLFLELLTAALTVLEARIVEVIRMVDFNDVTLIEVGFLVEVEDFLVEDFVEDSLAETEACTTAGSRLSKRSSRMVPAASKDGLLSMGPLTFALVMSAAKLSRFSSAAAAAAPLRSATEPRLSFEFNGAARTKAGARRPRRAT